MPYLTPSGDLVIPFDAPPRYRWWQGGQGAIATRNELLVRAQNAESEF